MGDTWLLSTLKGRCNPQIYAPQRRNLERWFECAEEVRGAPSLHSRVVGSWGQLCKPWEGLSSQACWQARVSRPLEQDACHVYGAPQVEEQYRVGGQEVLWYVVSDCAQLRSKAAEVFGAKVLLPRGDTPVEHVMHSSGNATRDVLAFRAAFAEQWLLGMTDFQVSVKRR